MKLTLSLLLLILTVGPLLGAQEQPQIAYRLLMGYIQENEKAGGVNKPLVGTLLFTLGSATLAGGLTTWFAGDAIAQSLMGTDLDPEAKLWTSVGLGVGGATLLGAGMLVVNSPDVNYRDQFSDVLTADDPQVQEQLAAATLLSLSDKAHDQRITSALAGILTPLLTSAITVAVNLDAGKPWSTNLFSVNSSLVLGFVGGVTGLFSPREEEYLYMKYQAAVGTPVR